MTTISHARIGAAAALAAAAALSGCVSGGAYHKMEVDAAQARRNTAECVKFSSDLQGRLNRLNARADSLAAERDQLQQEKQSLADALGAKPDELSKTIAKLRTDLGETSRDLAQAQGRLADFERQNAELKASADQLSARASRLDAERAKLQQANQDLSGSLNAKADELSRSVSSLSAEKQALEARIAALLKDQEELRARTEREIAQTRQTYESLVGELKGEIQEGQIKITQFAGKLSVNVAEKIFFDSGKADIKERGRKVLSRVGEILKHLTDKQIRVEGHTDDVPIRASLREKYPTNWELSTARATNVARFLVEKGGVGPSLVSAAGYGEYRPVAQNDTEEGRAKNRRIEIVLLDREVGRTASAGAAAPSGP